MAVANIFRSLGTIFLGLLGRKVLSQQASQVRVLVGPEWNRAGSIEILGQVLDLVGDLFEELRILAQQDVVVSTQCIGLLAIYPAIAITVLLSQLVGDGKQIQVCVGDMDRQQSVWL